ncbi:MAG: cag pathogenicity island protein Cag26 [bacterium]|nr:cag pathogenicity island protein Cag26 [bacterium]
MNKTAPSFFERALRFWRRENLHRILGVLLLLSLLSAIALWQLEDEQAKSFADWLWWSIVTLTTVGYGDITPASLGGRLIGIVLMFFGIGILSMLTATIASFFVERNLKRERGMGSYKLQDHIIICQWNARAQEVLRELRANPRTVKTPVLLLADIDSKPVDDDRLHFLCGNATEENLRQAVIDRAATVVILGDDRLDENARDAQVVLTALTVESLNPEVYTITELIEEDNARHCQRAKADEIIVGRVFSSHLIATATIDHGLSKVISEILSSRTGNDLEKIPVPEALAGREFLEVFSEMKRTNSSIVVAVKRGEEVVTNPAPGYRIEPTDHLIAIVDRSATS